MLTETLAQAEPIVLDRQALVRLYEEHSAGIYRYAYRLLGDQQLAEDCVSETFSRLLQAVKRGQGPSDNPKAYLYRVAHNWATDHYRRTPELAESLDSDNAPDPADPYSNPASLAHQNLERERIRQALRQLPTDQQRVVQLRFLEDWPHEQVAAAIGKSVEATRALQHRALAGLRRLLGDSPMPGL